MRNLAVLFVLALVLPTPCLADPHCSAEAVAQAAKLLAFHVDGDERARVEPTAVQLAPIRNPANRRQLLSVLEVDGYVYNGEYRMRFIYYTDGQRCLLMGQEILEHASL